MSDYSSVAPPQNFNQSSAFAAALQRAKQIAAKINPNTSGAPPGTDGNLSQKRPIEDPSCEPDAKKLNFGGNSMAPSNNFVPQAAQQGGNNQMVEIMLPGPKVGLIIGKGGEMIKQLQEKSGAKMVVIQDGPNVEQEKPLRITGDPQKVEHARQLVMEILNDKDSPQFQRNQANRGNRQGGGGFNDDYGGGQGGGQNENIEVLVPKPAVGVVIGKGGEMIKKIQAETGARVQFHQGRDEGPGDRRCFLSGKPQNVEAARQRVEDLIESVMQGGGNMRNRDRNSGNGSSRSNGSGNGGFSGSGGASWSQSPQQGGPPQVEYTFNVPTYKCGVIIGRGGETIKQINQQSGAHCEIDRRATAAGNGQEKIFTLRGEPECVEQAKRVISDKIQMNLYFHLVSSDANNSLNGGNAGMAGNMMSGGLPTAYPGMPQQSGNSMQGGYGQGWGGPGGPGSTPNTSGPGTPAPGSMPDSYQQPWNTQQSQPNQVQMNPHTGQPDYSKQWIDYYRSMGMHREAEMIEQQAKANADVGGGSGGGASNPVQATPTAQPNAVANGSGGMPTGGAGGAAGQADYSAQWAQYYRSIGKIKEAEVIEAQIKLKASGSATPASAGPAQPSIGGANVAMTGVQPGAGGQQPFGYGGGYPGFYPQANTQGGNPMQGGGGGAPSGPGGGPPGQFNFGQFAGNYGGPQQPQQDN